MPQVRSNGVTLEYDTFGAPGDEAIVLVSGLGTQMIRWAQGFCEGLAARGFHVIRFDNRDAGLSMHFNDAPVPDMGAVAMAVAQGRKPDVPYTLHDMAADAVGLMDGLGIARAHVVGRSMGGMIAQVIAAAYPARTLSLTSIMSSTGNPGLPPPKPEAMAVLMQRGPDPSADESAWLAHAVASARVLASPGFPFDEIAQRAQLRTELHRAFNPTGAGRQIAAIAATGDRRPMLATITAPTLVIHGDADPLIPVAAGRDTAATIPGAELMIIEGMGHDLPPAVHDRVVDAIARLRDRRPPAGNGV